MSHAIIRGKNGRRHEVDFGDAPIRVEVYASEETALPTLSMAARKSRVDRIATVSFGNTRPETLVRSCTWLAVCHADQIDFDE
jgi:hypothetical protein